MSLHRVLSVVQPWASLLVCGLKDVENRTWPTRYRGQMLIHASKAMAQDDLDACGAAMDANHVTKEALAAFGLAKVGDLPRGSIIGQVTVVDCVRNHQSGWAAPDQWHWVVAEPRRCRPIPWKGRLGIWGWGGEPEWLP